MGGLAAGFSWAEGRPIVGGDKPQHRSLPKRRRLTTGRTIFYIVSYRKIGITFLWRESCGT
jgi:hypothetical protein